MGKHMRKLGAINTVYCKPIVKSKPIMYPEVKLIDSSEVIDTTIASTSSGGIITIHDLSDYRIKNTASFLIPEVSCILQKLIESRRSLDCIPTL